MIAKDMVMEFFACAETEDIVGRMVAECCGRVCDGELFGFIGSELHGKICRID